MLSPEERKRILGEEPAPLSYQIKIEHHPDCPLGQNGLNAYWEARVALSSTPPEAQATTEDRIALCLAQYDLEQKQVCQCAADVTKKKIRELATRFFPENELRQLAGLLMIPAITAIRTNEK